MERGYKTELHGCAEAAGCGCSHGHTPAAQCACTGKDAAGCGCGCEHREDAQRKRFLLRLGGAALLFAAALLLRAGELQAYALPCFAAAYLLAGYDVLLGAARNIARGRVFDERFLMGLATLGAWAIGEYPEAVAVMLFYQLGAGFEDMAVDKSRRSIAALMDIRPDTATVLRDGKELRLHPEAVAVGECILVRPGERVPLDGCIEAGSTALDLSALTGESLPVDKTVGDRVLSGSLNQSGLIRVRVESPYGESTAARILELVEHAAQRKAPVERFISRFARVYTPCVVFGALLLALLPPLLFARPWAVWIERALIFLVVSCPCALVVSIPLSFFAGVGGASRKGILVKGAQHLETLARTDTLVFDKTGTLTQGRFHVAQLCPAGADAAALLETAAAVERYSAHPLAACIREACAKPVDAARLGRVEELAGLGVRAELDGAWAYAGKAQLMERAGVEAFPCEGALSVVHVAHAGRYLGYIRICDTRKPGAKAALLRLRALGIRKTVMLTGDTRQAAAEVAAALGIDEVHAELLPGEKLEAVERLLGAQRGGKLAFVGDGVNDAPALSRADLGIAMGALGSDAAIEAADVVIMDDRLERLAQALAAGRKTLRIARENIAFALCVKGGILLLGALGLTGMWTAVFADVGVMVLAVFNAMRALRV